MPADITVPLPEYLQTSYRPDREYVDGELLERNVGEWEHSRLQGLIYGYLLFREKQWNILAVPEQRVQVKPSRFRVPDITVIRGSRPERGIVTEPPFLCIEILSPEDRLTEMRERVSDYLEFGVRYVWVIDPVTRRATIYRGEDIFDVRDGVLWTESPEIVVRLGDLE